MELAEVDHGVQDGPHGRVGHDLEHAVLGGVRLGEQRVGRPYATREVGDLADLLELDGLVAHVVVVALASDLRVDLRGSEMGRGEENTADGEDEVEDVQPVDEADDGALLIEDGQREDL